jgi:uncharacterized repeat protein (TIGR03803 family)
LPTALAKNGLVAGAGGVTVEPAMKKVFLPLIVAFMSSQLSAQTYNVLHNFPGNSRDGYAPASSLVSDGTTLYGTTISGGRGGNGTIFRIDMNGSNYAVIKNFTNSEGANPGAGMVLSSGVLYGTTESGGSVGNGTAFMVNTDGTGYAVLKNFPATVPSFGGTNGDGYKPTGDLILDNGILYGTTSGGGAAGNGTVFKLNTDGFGFTVLKTFSSIYQGTNNVSLSLSIRGTNSDGAKPAAGLVLGGSTLYGTTFSGGTSSNGVVFNVQTDGTGFAVLKYFSGLTNPPGFPYGTNSDGANPRAGLALSGDTLYGMTVNGGALFDGTIFKLTTNGTGFAVLKNYYSDDGAWPYNTLLIDGHTLYGACFGGISNKGVVFRTDTSGSNYSVLKYMSPPDGFYSYSRLILSSNQLYGTTYYGGTNNSGVVFALTVQPQILAGDGSFGVRSNAFGFNVAGVSNQIVIIEASSNLTGSAWLPLQTNMLDGSADCFLDPAWTNFPTRFYRVRTQ